MEFLGLALLLGGVGARIRASKDYVELFEDRHRGKPGPTWLWRRDADPEVEKLRGGAAKATLIAIIGVAVLLTGLYT